MVMMEKELRRAAMPRPKKVKRISVSKKRQISIPKEFHDLLNIGEEITLELHGNHLVLKPIHESFEDFSEDILSDLIAEGYNGPELIMEFRNRKGQIGNAVESLISETISKGKKTTIDDLFGDDSEE
jgi:bifunctional DNA-binding transcriptional regulator/antitoxin component of YhaV-PrlF toxin-antitoxin module